MITVVVVYRATLGDHELRERLLADCLASVVGQAPGGVVLVDNASEVPPPAFEGVRVCRTDWELSVGAARLEGLARVDTPYVAFVDADHTFPDRTFSHLYNQIDQVPGAVAASGRIALHDHDNGADTDTEWPPTNARWLSRRPRLLALANARRRVVPAVNGALLDTGVVKRAGGPDDADLHPDWGLAQALILRGSWVISDRTCAFQRSTPELPTLASSVTREDERALRRRIRRRLKADPSAPRWLRSWLVLAALGLLHSLDVARIRRHG
jgi:hypothetical protein